MNWLSETGRSYENELLGEDRARFDALVDEMAESMLRGDSFDIGALCQREQALRIPLQHAFDSLSMLQGLSSDVGTTQFGELGDFQIIAEIGRGGMGVVYEAKQQSLGRRVALKVLPYAAFLSPSRLQRFKQEAQAAAMLRHSNIVHVHCVGSERGTHYYAMELIEGQSLANVISDARHSRTVSAHAETVPIAALSTANSGEDFGHCLQVAKLGIQIADALEYAHQQGVVHRDIKPSNLMLDVTGKPWITDFGLAQTQSEGSLTATGDVLGTLRYMSPEQAEGTKLLDQRTDIYSLAASLYELVTLEPVVSGETRQEMLRQLEDGHKRSPRSIDPRTPKDFEKVLLKALSYRAEDRYASAADFANDLRRFTEHRPVTARPVGRFQTAARWMARHRLVSSLIVSTSFLLVSIAIVGPLAAWRFQTLAKVAQAERDEAKQRNDELTDVLAETIIATIQTLENVPDNPLIKEEFITNTFDRIDRLLRDDPTNPKLRHVAGIAYRDLAWAAEFRYSDPRDVGWFLYSRDILSELVQDYPDNLEYRHDLSIAMWMVITETTVANDNDLDKYLQFNRDLVRHDPEDTRYQTSHAMGLGTAARWGAEKGDFETAQRLYDECDAALVAVIENAPKDVDARCLRAWYLHQQTQRIPHTRKKAIPKLRLALELYGDDFSNSTIVTRWKIGRAYLFRCLASNLRCENQLDEAEHLARKSTAETTSLMNGFPESKWLNQEYFYSHRCLMRVLRTRGDTQAAIDCGRQIAGDRGKNSRR